MSADKRGLTQMNGNEEREKLNDVSRRAIECAFRVGNTLGCGFLEKVYENAMAIELRAAGISVIQQPKVDVRYRDQLVGEYIPDLILDDHLILEIKALPSLDQGHLAQCLNYLRATRLKLGLVLNFGRPRVQFQRVVWKF